MEVQHWRWETWKSKIFLIVQYIRFALFSSWIQKPGCVEDPEVRF